MNSKIVLAIGEDAIKLLNKAEINIDKVFIDIQYSHLYHNLKVLDFSNKLFSGLEDDNFWWVGEECFELHKRKFAGIIKNATKVIVVNNSISEKYFGFISSLLKYTNRQKRETIFIGNKNILSEKCLDFYFSKYCRFEDIFETSQKQIFNRMSILEYEGIQNLTFIDKIQKYS